jgi:transcriptional regulator with PAS, ATPase and Fis domain
VDVRVIATTNRRLEESVERKEFRQDLFFRLNVVPIHVAPLRAHKEDVSFLAHQFMPRFDRKHGVRVHGISDDCLGALTAHHWPGNVRELQNVIERAVILCGDSGLLEPEHLGFSIAASPAPSVPFAPTAPSNSSLERTAPAEPEPVSLAEVEKRHILAALEKTKQNRTHAAKLLDISIRTLRNKLNEYGVKSREPESAAAAEE